MEQQTPPLQSEPKYSFCQWFFDTSAEVGRILIPPPRECTRSVWSSAFRRPFERRSSSRVNAELQTGGGSRMRPQKLGAWQFRWGFPMRLSQRIQFGLDECRRALARAGRWLPPLVLATDGRLKNSIIPH